MKHTGIKIDSRLFHFQQYLISTNLLSSLFHHPSPISYLTN